ncbi:MAG: FAD/NAD(P)-binding oxidoreductase [Chloroflexi bacterium]|nr:FAD/NAD(P)-binding oxidoreductase [Chloroflexota bacterium]
MAGKKIAVVGGGFGGVAAARTARAMLGLEHDVLLIDRNKRTYLCGSFPLLIIGEREASKVSRSLGSLAKRGVRHVQTEVEAIDTDARTVRSSEGTLDYDFLVLAPGAAYDWDAVPGASEAYSFYDLASARRLRRKLATFRKGRVLIAISSVPYKCPPAPFEAAMTLEWDFQRRGVRSDIDMHVFTPEPMPLAVAGPDAGARLTRDMERRGIQVHTGAGVTEVATDGRQAAFSDGQSLDADLVITIPTHRAPELMEEAGLLGPSGWVHVTPETLEADRPGIYAIGDVNNVPMANGRGLPKAGVFASSEGETVGHNIAAAILGEEPRRFSGVGHCFVAYGGTKGGMIRGEFLAGGKPNVTFQPPSARGYRAKERFERDWRRFRV